MLILGIESSCDETGLALYDSEQGLVGHCLHSQIAVHRKYGGVVPELASRDHIRHTIALLQQLMDHQAIKTQAIDVVAFTQGPGLAGALLVGASIANSLGYAWGKPVIGIHHLEGHLLSPLLSEPDLPFPFVALLVSGGHTQLVMVERIGHYTLLGETLDDAAGEALDKCAQLLGLPYPGGAALAALAKGVAHSTFTLPRPLQGRSSLDFSFSGLKTAFATQYRHLEQPLSPQIKAELAHAVLDAVVEVLTTKSIGALQQTGCRNLVTVGGVSANRQLRAALNRAAQEHGFTSHYPDLAFCGDNGAMIAAAAAFRLKQQPDLAKTDYGFCVYPRWPLEEIGKLSPSRYDSSTIHPF